MMQPTLFDKKGIPLCPVCLGNRVKMGNGGPLWILPVSFHLRMWEIVLSAI